MKGSNPTLAIKIGNVRLKNPVILASGPMSRHGKAIKRAAQCGAGAVVTKTIRMEAAKNVPRPCIIKFSSGLLNTELWSDLGYEDWIDREIKIAKQGGVPLIATIGSQEPMEIENMAYEVVDAGADIIQLNCSSNKVETLIKSIRKVTDTPIILKFSPSTWEAKDAMVPISIMEFSELAEQTGVDAVNVSDTFGPCLRIDIQTGKPVLGSLSGIGGISGPAIKPFITYYVYYLARTLKIPIIGTGGVMTGEDAIESIMAGATAVGVCTAAILKGPEQLGKIVRGIETFLKEKNVRDINEIKGVALRHIIEREERGFINTKGLPPRIQSSLCTACGICETSCPYDAITIKKIAMVNKNLCYGCGLCSSVCPTNAISLQY